MVMLLLCPKPCLSQTVLERAQNGTQPDCPKSCPEALSIIVIGGTRHDLGQGIRVSRTVLSPQARFETCDECPKPCLGMNCARSGTVRDSSRVCRNVDLQQARFGTHAVCPKPCKGTVWDKARFGTQQLPFRRDGTRPVPGQSPVLTRAACGRVPTGSYSSAGQLSGPWRGPEGILARPWWDPVVFGDRPREYVIRTVAQGVPTWSARHAWPSAVACIVRCASDSTQKHVRRVVTVALLNLPCQIHLLPYQAHLTCRPIHRENARQPLPAGLKLAITLRFLATGNSYGSLEFAFRAGACPAARRVPGSEVTASLRRISPNGARSDFNSELKSIRRPRGAKNRLAAVGKPAGLRPVYKDDLTGDCQLVSKMPRKAQKKSTRQDPKKRAAEDTRAASDDEVNRWCTHLQRASEHAARVGTACTRQRGNRTEIVRCKHVQLTYHLRNVRCTQPLTARRVVQTTKNVADVATTKTYGQKARTASRDRRFNATVTRRTCFCVLSTCKNVGNRRASVRVYKDDLTGDCQLVFKMPRKAQKKTTRQDPKKRAAEDTRAASDDEVQPVRGNVAIAQRSYVVSTYNSPLAQRTMHANADGQACRADHVGTPCATVRVTYSLGRSPYVFRKT
ncbi:hypothetical protein Bbelb_053320 [Branchiostoma belcheri]|nr:hypothetical protein Bbelb_053320 [Branchiostoma belcheri]